MSAHPTESQILNDVLTMMMTNATTTHLGRGVPTSTSLALKQNGTLVITFADGVKFALTVKVEQLNMNAGRV